MNNLLNGDVRFIQMDECLIAEDNEYTENWIEQFKHIVSDMGLSGRSVVVMKVLIPQCVDDVYMIDVRTTSKIGNIVDGMRRAFRDTNDEQAPVDFEYHCYTYRHFECHMFIVPGSIGAFAAKFAHRKLSLIATMDINNFARVGRGECNGVTIECVREIDDEMIARDITSDIVYSYNVGSGRHKWLRVLTNHPIESYSHNSGNNWVTTIHDIDDWVDAWRRLNLIISETFNKD